MIQSFELATLNAQETSQMFFGRLGKRVIFIQYYDYEDLGALVEEFFAVNDFDVPKIHEQITVHKGAYFRHPFLFVNKNMVTLYF